MVKSKLLKVRLLAALFAIVAVFSFATANASAASINFCRDKFVCQLRSTFYGRCITIAGASKSNGAYTVQGNCYYQAEGSISLQYSSAGNYQILFEHSGKCLEVPGGSTATGTRLTQNTCSWANKHRWFLDSTGITDTYRLRNAATGKCAYSELGSLITQRGCTTTDAMFRWKLIP